ncbi:hypothetical protein PF005_g584 [Phytophthora fragariae]|uniref:Cyclic nucleotide-binding domain-containing protein n=1 Tax=Phytophthora fragariae TaxID=53985 RepID=A0A6A3ZJC7_9STRA|nr:hypothetical protein PF005_g584 [Phytophthora fragariae]
MDVSKRLTTQQLHSVAEALQYVELSIGNTVYKCGEEGSAAYFILSGRVRLFNGQERSTTTIKSPLTSLTDDFWSIDLCEGDVFGTEALTGDSRRLTTALAVGGVTGDTPVSLNQKFSTATAPLKLHKRSTLNRWKAAVFQITRNRPRWMSTLHQEFNYRIGLTFALVNHLPLFKDIPKQQCFDICKRCMVEVAALDSVVFGRDDELMDQMFFVIEGSVTIQQVLDSPLPVSAALVTGSSLDARGTKVIVRVLKPGDTFGEVELMLESSRRLIEATVSSPSTKLLRVPKAVFISLWPQRDRFESKLTTLKRAFAAASPLEPEQLCSMYYSVKELSFKRNEVIFGSYTPQGTLFMVESGLCIMHNKRFVEQQYPD